MAVWTDKFIAINPYSRSGAKLTGVRKIVVHWTANYGATALNHYNYFNNLKDRYASAHLFVDKTEALCIIPLNEVAFHANDGTYRGIEELKPNANYLSIGVEMCVESDGTFHPDTINRTEEVVAELCKRYNLDPIADVVRHYDVTQKNCPAPWVSNATAFSNFKKEVLTILSQATSAGNTTNPTTGGTGTMKLELTASQFDQLATVLNKAYVDGFLSSLEWAQKAKDHTLTVSEAVFLALLLDHRHQYNIVL